ncbi:hypothetical protein EDD86DRAFT_194001 [Gorgonomyces haynaldii]|nr:hypothetical protein EDD86DRAFT_194001 [Gorgonomyces haynaldii]
MAETEWKKASTGTEHIQLNRKILEKNPFNQGLWQQVIQEIIQLNDPAIARPIFNDFFNVYPTNLQMWIKRIEFETKQRAYDELEKIFASCLVSVPCVPLCEMYMDYVLHINPLDKLSAEEAKEARLTIVKAFEFVLSSVGTDVESGVLWLKYINFIKSGEAHSTFEEQQKMEQLRKIFHRAIHTPLHNVEDIWKEYDVYENSLNKLTAKKFISDKAAGYMTARSVMKDFKSLLEPFQKVSQTWFASPPTWTHQEVTLLGQWKRYIEWEKSNPLQLEDQRLMQRVIYAYKSCLLQFRFFAEIWYDYCSYLSANNKQDDAIAQLKHALQVNPTSLLLSFTLAEYEEGRKAEFTVIQAIFEQLLEKLEKEHEQVNKRYNEEAQALTQLLKEASRGEDQEKEEEWDGERREKEREILKEIEQEVYYRVEVKRHKRIEEIKSSVSLTWIIYMRFSRRSQNIKQARLIFTRARKSKLITSHVYTASALMEFYVNKDPVVAGKIFELGLKTFNIAEDPHAAEFICRYVDFLICLNDDNNTRALFERALAAIPAERSKKVWAMYVNYETQYGDLANLNKLQSRRDLAIERKTVDLLESVSNIGEKWGCYDINYIASMELGISALKAIGRQAPPQIQEQTNKSGLQVMRADEKGRQFAILGAVQSDKYPRPDFGRWVPYKAEPGQAKVLIKREAAPKPRSPVHEKPVERGESVAVPESVAALFNVLPSKSSYTGN